MIKRSQEHILKWANTLNNIEDITKAMGKEWVNSQLKVATEIVTLARKGLLQTDKAHNLVKGMPCEKFIDMPLGSGLKGIVPKRVENISTIHTKS